MPSGYSRPGRTRGNLTPLVELGHASLTPNDSDSEDDNGQDELAASSVLESQGLVGSSSVARRPPGWITISGFSLPRPLAYLVALPIVVVLLYTLNLFSARPAARPVLSNGTHPFHPTTLLISLDGFRPSYLESHPDLTRNLQAMATSPHGLRAESMQPRFPTLTFPNHWSLMTGLYPESHGIIANDFWDPETREQFVYVKEEHSWASHWWWGEPLWSVVERAGRISANIMWPGPPQLSNGIAPTYFVPFRKASPTEKLDQLLEWFNLPLSTRPQLVTLYIPNVDQVGHSYGPDSQEVADAIQLVDQSIGDIVSSIAERNLTDIVNVLVVSDHGMTDTANDRLIYLDDILGDGYEKIEHRDGWPCVGLRFEKGSPVEEYLGRLEAAASLSNGSFSVYTRATMLQRWHFNATDRISPILMVPHVGWAITDRHEHYVVKRGDYTPKGNHGYDNVEPDMQAIFFAQGPFVKKLKDGSRRRDGMARSGWVSTEPHVMKAFGNLEIFSLVVRLLDAGAYEPPHNGTAGFWDEYLRSEE